MARNYFSPYSFKLVLPDAIRQNSQNEQHQSKRMSNVSRLACQYQYKFCVLLRLEYFPNRKKSSRNYVGLRQGSCWKISAKR